MVIFNQIALMLSPFYLKSRLLSKSYNKFLCYGNFFNMRNIHSSAITNNFWELTKRGRYHKEINVPKTKLIKDGLKELKGEVYKWKEEVKDVFEGDPLFVFRPGGLTTSNSHNYCISIIFI